MVCWWLQVLQQEPAGAVKEQGWETKSQSSGKLAGSHRGSLGPALVDCPEHIVDWNPFSFLILTLGIKGKKSKFFDLKKKSERGNIVF